MKISTDFPPVYDAVCAHFDIRGKRVVFTYGDTIFNPSNAHIDEHLEIHEAVHATQQEKIGGPDIWWQKFLKDPRFRLEQELEAYRAQYASFCRAELDRNKRVRFLMDIARDLSSPMYGSPISLLGAMDAIR